MSKFKNTGEKSVPGYKLNKLPCIQDIDLLKPK